MADTDLMDQFIRLCDRLDLGAPIKKPMTIYGGLLHHMYRLETNRGVFAVKALNPEILRRPEARQNYLLSERIANRVKTAGLPAVTALTFGGSFLIEQDGLHFMLFPWVHGQTIRSEKVLSEQVRQIGGILAKIHTLNIKEATTTPNPPDFIDWRSWLAQGKSQNLAWAEPLQCHVKDLERMNEAAITSAKKAAPEYRCSHRDMDPKNVLWSHGKPWIIDWEAAGPIHPIQELTELAFAWSASRTNRIDPHAFDAFLTSYFADSPRFETSFADAFDMVYSSPLGWLEYNLKRSLGHECRDESDRQLGIAESLKTLQELSTYAAFQPQAIQLAQPGS